VGAALELTDEARERIRELQDLSRRVEEGEEDLRPELRQAVRESSPEVIARCSDIARTYRWILANTASGQDPLMEEAFVKRTEMLAQEIAGENPTPLEVLLSERIASLWALTELQEALLSATYRRGQKKPVGPAYTLQMCRIQESTNRRYLAAIKTLAQVRKLQASTPAVHLTQINVR
jgi:hypothetical protein